MLKGLKHGISFTILIVLASFFAIPAAAQDMTDTAADELTLTTDTPEEGFALAIALSRKAVTETQPNTDVLHALRPGYSHNAEDLIAVSHVVAVHFQTVAAANNYWRE